MRWRCPPIGLAAVKRPVAWAPNCACGRSPRRHHAAMPGADPVELRVARTRIVVAVEAGGHRRLREPLVGRHDGRGLGIVGAVGLTQTDAVHVAVDIPRIDDAVDLPGQVVGRRAGVAGTATRLVGPGYSGLCPYCEFALFQTPLSRRNQGLPARPNVLGRETEAEKSPSGEGRGDGPKYDRLLLVGRIRYREVLPPAGQLAGCACQPPGCGGNDRSQAGAIVVGVKICCRGTHSRPAMLGRTSLSLPTALSR